MPGTVISKHMNLGYAGKISRDADAIVFNRIVDEDSADIPFGAPVCLADDNFYTGWVAESTSAVLAGIAVASVKQSTTYGVDKVVYKAGQICDVLARGTATVICSKGTPTAGGKVYLRVLENAAYPLSKVGDWEAEEDITPEVEAVEAVEAIIGSGTEEEPEFPAVEAVEAVEAVVRTVEVSGMKWTTGYKDANDVAEVTLLTRKNP